MSTAVHLPLDLRFKITAYYQQHQDRLQTLTDVEISDELFEQFKRRISAGQILSVRKSLGLKKVTGRKPEHQAGDITELQRAIANLNDRVTRLEEKGGAQ